MCLDTARFKAARFYATNGKGSKKDSFLLFWYKENRYSFYKQPGEEHLENESSKRQRRNVLT